MIKKNKNINVDPYWFLEATVHQERNNIFNLAYRLCQDEEEAKEIAQTSFLKTLKNYRRFESIFHIYIFLCRTTFNLWRSRTRHNQKKPALSPSCSGLILSEVTCEKKKLLQLIQKGLSGLPESDNFIVVLRDIEGKSYLEIACILKCRYLKVKSRLAQARKRLHANILPSPKNITILSRDCHTYSELFSDQLDNLLLPNLEANLYEHLNNCPECQKKFQEMETIQKLLSGIDLVKPPDDFEAGILKIAKKIIARKPVLRYRLKYILYGLGSAVIISSLFVIFYLKPTLQSELIVQPPVAFKNRPKPLRQFIIAGRISRLEKELFRSAPPPHTIIRNEQEWANIWRLQNAGQNISAPLPEIDFNSKMVIAIISQDDKTEYAITRTEETKEKVIVFCKGTSLTHKNPPLPLYQFLIVVAEPTVEFTMFREQ